MSRQNSNAIRKKRASMPLFVVDSQQPGSLYTRLLRAMVQKLNASPNEMTGYTFNLSTFCCVEAIWA